MEYFRIRQDQRYPRPPVITNITDMVPGRRGVSRENAESIPDVNVLFANAPYPLDFLDVLDSQLFLVSPEVKKVFRIYEPGMVFKEVCILNNKSEEHRLYALPLFLKMDCLAEGSIVCPDRSQVKRLCLRKDPEAPSIFKIAGLMTDIVMLRLDVAENLLRRGIRRFVLEAVEWEEEGHPLLSVGREPGLVPSGQQGAFEGISPGGGDGL